jgi:hypothetical protein
MSSTELFFICAVAFLMVFIILALLAFSMRIIILIFPEKKAKLDAAMIAAVTAAVQTIIPGTKVTKVEEE